MIYVCVAARNDASTVGLLLWKLRKVFEEFPREYHILVADDASTDGTAELLETYQRALPMTLQRHQEPIGHAASLERLARDALRRSDRPKRDCLVTLPADFAVTPAAIPELLKRFESGADVVVGEIPLSREAVGTWLVRRCAPWLLRPGLSLPGVRDVTSGVSVIRLITLRGCLRDESERFLQSEGASAHAELVARTAARARQIAAVPLEVQASPVPPRRRASALAEVLSYFRAGRQLRIPAPTTTIQRG
ncbi:MAG: glycosyltransferase family 2 protein [Gemmatimonadota bacterium]|nr:MAG: glycosyltransferase family 2 protein [Gemmatimonadota bacterium]